MVYHYNKVKGLEREKYVFWIQIGEAEAILIFALNYTIPMMQHLC